ncbi:MAG: M15 family metallopeptidase, partial [Chloroflexales bacterium]
ADAHVRGIAAQRERGGRLVIRRGTPETELPLGGAAPADAAGLLLGGAAPAPSTDDLWRFLYGETFKPRGGALHFEWSFTTFAAAKGLGAPVGPNPPPVTSGGARYNYQPFARDTVYNIGTDYGDVRRLGDLLGPGTAIPASGPAYDLLAASYRAALDAAAARGVALTGNRVLNPGWKFHQVARGTGLGPALSGNYLTADRRYIVQAFAGDTLFTPVAQPAGCSRLSQIGADNPAYGPVWAETYKAAPAPFDPNSPWHKKAVGLRIGAPLTGIYTVALGATTYAVQVWALDTLYAGSDGQIRRMSDLPLPDTISWPPPPPKPQVHHLAISVGPAKAGDPSWPPPPPFSFLAAKAGAVEAALGRLAWVRDPAAADKDTIRITNGWDADNLVVVDIPQLRAFAAAGYGKLRFHKKAAAQLQQLFSDWEAAGLLRLILSFDGAYSPRTIRATVPGKVTDTLSNHAYGTAFDLNAARNPFMGQPALAGQPGSLRELVPLAYANGFYWGGHFTYSGGGHDGMHFEWAVPV